ncbi:MAG: hypothetical protein ACREQY_02245 [Candidatus Binatia bacterium]
MRISRTITAGTAVVATLFAFGCAKRTETATTDPEQTTPQVAEQELPGTSAPSDIAPTTAMARVEELKVGPELGPDGAVKENVDDFDPGEPIYASIAVGDIGVGSAVEAIWTGPDDTRIHSEVKDVLQGATIVVFQAPNTASWKPGDYAVEIRLGDELGGREGFEIEEKAG